GLAAATKALARKYAADGVLINSVMPGRVRTAMWERTALEIAESRGSADQEAIEAVFTERSADIPIGRYGTSREIANAVLFLCSDLASYFAGATIDVDGGLGSHVYRGVFSWASTPSARPPATTCPPAPPSRPPPPAAPAPSLTSARTG